MLRKKITDILIDLGFISKEQLQKFLSEEKVKEEFAGQLLVEKGLITKTQLSQALAQLLGLPFVEKITEQMADPQMLGKVPLKFLKQHTVIPIIFEGKKVIVTANPRELQPLDELSLLLGEDIGYAIATEQMINDAINKYYPLESAKEMMGELSEEEEEFDLGTIEEKDIMEMAYEAPIVKLVNHIIYQAVKEGASDIHIEPFEKELRVRYRIDGQMREVMIPPKRYQGAIVSRIKIMSNLNIAEKRIPQDGRIQLKVADKPIDIRVSILPCNFGERVVMRLLDKSKGIIPIEKLNLSSHNYKILIDAIEKPNGIILISGPTGSGKTTTLYSILNRLNDIDVNIITVEDPVEYTIKGISQVQVNEKVGLTFASALRSILRQDPDIVLIGEIRDLETSQIAIQAALTGHLVLSTIHTNSAPATITRLIDMGIEPFLIASSVILIVSQRLVRKLCDKCKQPYHPTPDLLAKIGLSEEKAKSITFYKPVGCDECLQSGYKGRLALFEIMKIDSEITPLIMQRKDASIIKKAAQKMGMKTLGEDGLRFIEEGKTTIEEVLSVAYLEQAE